MVDISDFYTAYLLRYIRQCFKALLVSLFGNEPEMAQSESRSPSYPQIGLNRAVELVRRLYEGIHRGSVGTSAAQKIMGFSGSSGTGLANLSALKRFGLIEGRDPNIRITELGFRLLEPMDQHERQSALREAALSPPIFAAILSDFGGKLPADAAIRAKLIREHGFTPAGVESFIRSFRDTFSLIQSEETGGTPEAQSSQLEHTELGRTADAQLPSQRATTSPIPSSAAASPEAFTEPGMTRAAFPLVEGNVYLTFPSNLSAEGYGELAEYLQIFLRRAERLKRQNEAAKDEDFDDIA